MGKRILVSAMLALCLSGLTACGAEYERTEITPTQASHPLGGTVSAQRIDVPEGLVLTARVVIYDDDGEIMPFTIRSKEPAILKVDPVVNVHNYSFIGVAQGQTEIEFVADDSVVLTVTATVMKQPEQP